MKELKSFLTKIRPTLLLIKAPLVSARDLTADVETHDFDVSKMFLPQLKYFLTKFRPILLITEVPPAEPKDLTRDMETHNFDVSKIFFPKTSNFFHRAAHAYPLLRLSFFLLIRRIMR